jgi:hypothetical protein
LCLRRAVLRGNDTAHDLNLLHDALNEGGWRFVRSRWSHPRLFWAKASRIFDASQSRTTPCLKTLADASGGVSEELLVVAHGFAAEMLAGLALATVVTETRTVRRGVTIKVERYRITDDGRRAIEEWP